jgi:hypothetical protein
MYATFNDMVESKVGAAADSRAALPSTFTSMSSSGLRRVRNLLNAVRRNLLPAGRGLPKTTLPDGQKVLFTYERQIPWADRAHGVAFSTAASIASGSCM